MNLLFIILGIYFVLTVPFVLCLFIAFIQDEAEYKRLKKWHIK